MVVDTSLLVQILFQEAGWQESLVFIVEAERKLCSVASLIEFQAVASKDKKASAREWLDRVDDLVLQLDLEIVPLSLKQAHIAREAYLTYGKGQGHRAALNYGDVMSYALAKATGERLAFVGDNFQYTDVKTVQLSGS